MSERLILGIDIGTSACKTAVFDECGNVIGEASKPYPVYQPYSGYAEQNPDEWYNAVCAALKEISETVDLSRISAVGVDGQSWSCIPIDKSGKVLSNTPIWFDTRSVKECEFLKETIGFDRLYNLCKNPIEPSYTTPKVLWFKNNYPEIYAGTDKFLQSNSYIVYRLTGEFSQDKSQGFGHFFYDTAASKYDEATAEAMGIDINKFPDIFGCDEIVGTVNKKAAEETGLKIGTPVVAGGLDAACGTLGAGVVKKGQTQEQGGQAGGMSICTDKPVSDKCLILGNHVVDGLWLLQGGTVAGGAAMEWFGKTFGKAFADDNVFFEIDKAAEAVSPASDGMIFLPYMNGERSPIWNPDAKGVYYGLSFDKSKGHFARATMEGVAFALRHNLEAAKAAGAEFDTLYATGGSANSRIWMQIKADVTGHNMAVPNSKNGTALGAAILAGVGSGVYDSFEDAVAKTVNIKKEYSPNAANKEIYDKAFEKYIKIYKQLEEVMSE